MEYDDNNQNDTSLINESDFHAKAREGGGKPNNPSIEITIPKWFCEKHKIKRGDYIKLKFEGFLVRGGKQDAKRKK